MTLESSMAAFMKLMLEILGLKTLVAFVMELDGYIEFEQLDTH